MLAGWQHPALALPAAPAACCSAASWCDSYTCIRTQTRQHGRVPDHTARSTAPTHPGQLEVQLCLVPVLMPPLNDAAVQLNLAAAPAHLQAEHKKGDGDGKEQVCMAVQAAEDGFYLE